MVILVTGCSGFIGYHLTKSILKKYKSTTIIGLDNMNSYYDKNLKYKRKNILLKLKSKKFKFFKINLNNKEKINQLFKKYKFTTVYHLAAQAGVRYSIKSPEQYINSNILGFYNILESAKKFKTKNLFFASSSSVYGNRVQKNEFEEKFNTDKPVSFYAATKKTNEIMAYCYSNLYNIKIIGLRFFTVYGPLGRPDMAYYKFTKKILNNEKIDLYNKGIHSRDFTYIDDAINSILLLRKNLKKIETNFEIFNIGASNPIKLSRFISILEKYIGKKARKKKISFQKGDVFKTSASISKLKKITGYRPKVGINEGIEKFISWYRHYHK